MSINEKQNKGEIREMLPAQRVEASNFTRVLNRPIGSEAMLMIS